MLIKEVEPSKLVEPQCPRGCVPETWKMVIGYVLMALFVVGVVSTGVGAIAYDEGLHNGRNQFWSTAAKDLEQRRACVIQRREWIDGPESCFPNKDSK